MIYPKNIKTAKSKIAYWSLRQWYTLSQGRGQVIGRITGMLPELTSIVILVELYTPLKLNLIGILTLIFASFFGSWAIGKWWMNNNLDKIDQQVIAERNPILHEIHKKVVKRREEL